MSDPTPGLIVNAMTGVGLLVPLTPADQIIKDAADAAAPALAAAQALNASNAVAVQAAIASALARLRQIQNANPASATPLQVAQAVSDMATVLLRLARWVSNQFDGTG